MPIGLLNNKWFHNSKQTQNYTQLQIKKVVTFMLKFYFNLFISKPWRFVLIFSGSSDINLNFEQQKIFFFYYRSFWTFYFFYIKSSFWNHLGNFRHLLLLMKSKQSERISDFYIFLIFSSVYIPFPIAPRPLFFSCIN